MTRVVALHQFTFASLFTIINMSLILRIFLILYKDKKHFIWRRITLDPIFLTRCEVSRSFFNLFNISLRKVLLVKVAIRVVCIYLHIYVCFYFKTILICVANDYYIKLLYYIKKKKDRSQEHAFKKKTFLFGTPCIPFFLSLFINL